MLRGLSFFAAAFAVASFYTAESITPAFAASACNSVCEQHCRENPGGQSVANCIKLWSCIHAKYGPAKEFLHQPPPPECRHLAKPRGCGGGFVAGGQCYGWGGR
jgi:hypothetical protein